MKLRSVYGTGSRRYPLSSWLLQDSWVIIPEILKQFPATSYTAAFADSEQSELIAREYRILKYPALLFFRQHRFVGSLAGLYSWQEYSQRVAALLTTPGYRQDIPVITQ